MDDKGVGEVFLVGLKLKTEMRESGAGRHLVLGLEGRQEDEALSSRDVEGEVLCASLWVARDEVKEKMEVDIAEQLECIRLGRLRSFPEQALVEGGRGKQLVEPLSDASKAAEVEVIEGRLLEDLEPDLLGNPRLGGDGRHAVPEDCSR